MHDCVNDREHDKTSVTWIHNMVTLILLQLFCQPTATSGDGYSHNWLSLRSADPSPFSFSFVLVLVGNKITELGTYKLTMSQGLGLALEYGLPVYVCMVCGIIVQRQTQLS